MSDAPPPTDQNRGLNLLLPLTTLLSAWLLFQVQPMVAKRILPWFGGGAAVWTTAMLFFQAALFVGYLYAHWLAQSLSGRKQVLLHAVLLAAAAALVGASGVLPADAWKPEPGSRPALGILAMLAACVGLPYLMLAATAPLVQVWFSRANPGRSPYRLYAISNVGSLAALLSYPLLLEPTLGVTQQGVAWSALFLVFALACATSGLLSLRHERQPADAPESEPRGSSPRSAADDQPTRRQYFFWLALPACASLLLLAVTAFITQNIAPIPLLWILPMVVYLLSFILSFDSDRWYARSFWMPLAAILSLAAVLVWNYQRLPSVTYLVGLHVLLLFAAAMVCHGELAAMRPSPTRLTSYYLCIAAGGALGGLLAAVVAPLVFSDHLELHFGLFLAWALALAVLITDRNSAFYDGGKGRAFAGLLVSIGLLIALTVGLFAHIRLQKVDSIAVTRNFYGVLHVFDKKGDLPYVELSNGHVAHGGQFKGEENRQAPMWYYHPESGVGKIFTALKLKPPRRVALIGLGTGSLAAYADAGDQFQIYDINPHVIEFADKYFTYLKDARERGADVKIIEGDARFSLERQPPQDFDVIALDAFNGDAIPMHLLTMEAFELYLRHLDEDGILAVHATNAYLRLDAVVNAAVERFHLDAVRYDTPRDMVPGAGSASWLLLHRRPRYFEENNFGAPLFPDSLEPPSVAWTDDYSNVLGILKW